MNIQELIEIIKTEKLDRHTDFEICIGEPRKGGKRIAGTGDRGSGVHGVFQDEDSMWREYHMDERGCVRISSDKGVPLSYTEEEACHAFLDMLRNEKAFSKESARLKRRFATKNFFGRL